MKYLILLIAVIFTLSVNAQDIERVGSKGTSKGWYDGLTPDSITDNQDTIEVTFLFQPDEPFLWHADIHLDTLSGFGADDSVKVEVFGKRFEHNDWSSIGAAQYFDDVGDNPIQFSEESTADFVRYIMIRYVKIGSDGGKATLYNANSIVGRRDIEFKGWW